MGFYPIAKARAHEAAADGMTGRTGPEGGQAGVSRILGLCGEKTEDFP